MQMAIFYILAAIILIFSVLTVTSRKILRAAVYLLFVLCAIAGLYFMFNYHFLAAVQLTVYAGGIVVLVIFAVLLTQRIDQLLAAPDTKKAIASGLASFSGAFLVISVLVQHEFPAAATFNNESTVKEIGTLLLETGEGGYVLPFEVISVLLLAAMIAAIVIAKREKPEEKAEA